MIRVIVVGAGGHAQVVADALLAARAAGAPFDLAGFVDADPGLTGAELLGARVIGDDTALALQPHEAVVVAIGDNAVRRSVAQRLAGAGERFAAVVHPSAIVAPGVAVGDGAMICAGVVVNTGSRIGAHAILNTACSIDHHNRIGEFAHVAPGAHTGGEVVIGDGVLLGIGAVVLPRRRVGAWAVVGGGGVVTADVAGRAVVTGIPAREARGRHRR